MKRICHILVQVLIVALLASCSKAGDMEILNYKMGGLNPTGLRSAAGSLNVEVCNNGPALEIGTTTGILFADDRTIGSLKAEPVTIEAKSTQWQKVFFSIRIDDNISLLEVIRTVRYSDISHFSLSYETEVKCGSAKRTIKEEKVPLANFIQKQ